MKRPIFDPVRPLPGYLDHARTPEAGYRRTARLAIAAVTAGAVVLVIWFFAGGVL